MKQSDNSSDFELAWEQGEQVHLAASEWINPQGDLLQGSLIQRGWTMPLSGNSK